VPIAPMRAVKVRLAGKLLVLMVTDPSSTTLTIEKVGMVEACALVPEIDSRGGTRIATARMMEIKYFIAVLLFCDGTLFNDVQAASVNSSGSRLA
jgi:hypothetical protein